MFFLRIPKIHGNPIMILFRNPESSEKLAAAIGTTIHNTHTIAQAFHIHSNSIWDMPSEVWHHQSGMRLQPMAARVCTIDIARDTRGHTFCWQYSKLIRILLYCGLLALFRFEFLKIFVVHWFSARRKQAFSIFTILLISTLKSRNSLKSRRYVINATHTTYPSAGKTRLSDHFKQARIDSIAVRSGLIRINQH